MFTTLSGSDRNKFVIDQTAKELRVGAQGLDREENTRATLVVEVQSSGINIEASQWSVLKEFREQLDRNATKQLSEKYALKFTFLELN